MSDYTKDFLDNISRKQDNIGSDIVEIKIVQAKQQISLDEHIRRSEALERAQEKLFNELEPIKTHVSRVDGAIKFIGIVSVIISILTGIVKLLQLL